MDTSKMRDISREQFEAAYERGDLLCVDGPYDNPRKNQALAIWNASREAVIVELPEEAPNEVHYEPWDTGYNQALRESRNAIEVQGLKVAP